MLLNLPGDKSSRKYYAILTVLLVFTFTYFVFVRNSSVKPKEVAKDIETKSASAYFIPPSSSTKEVKVTGKVVKIDEQEKPGATHKLVDNNGLTIIYAKTSDDKLKQQEGSIVNLVGEIPLNQEINDTSILFVNYIAFK
jgi:hypothetical protein